MEGGSGGRPLEKGASGVQEVGEEGGERDSQGDGKWEKNYATLHHILQSKKCKQAGARIKGCGKWEV